MNRTVKALTAALLALGVALVGLPLGTGGGASAASIGCCRT